MEELIKNIREVVNQHSKSLRAIAKKLKELEEMIEKLEVKKERDTKTETPDFITRLFK